MGGRLKYKSERYEQQRKMLGLMQEAEELKGARQAHAEREQKGSNLQVLDNACGRLQGVTELQLGKLTTNIYRTMERDSVSFQKFRDCVSRAQCFLESLS